MEKSWFVIHNGYVIDYIVWDGVTPWEYPGEYDELLEDVGEQPAGIGDWYEQAEGIFYRPLKTPPDYPPTENTP
jgi:hypothetical protein